MDTPIADAAPPSDWIVRWSAALAPGARVLDVACGRGRHARWFAAAGHAVTAVDRDATLLAPLAAAGMCTLEADLEGAPWPLPGERFDAVVVTHYLWRPLWPALLAAVVPGGWFLHETFALAQAAIGRPSRPEFLLRPGELVDVVRAAGEDWRIVAFEEGRLPARDALREREVQRIAARRGPRTAGGDPLLSPG